MNRVCFQSERDAEMSRFSTEVRVNASVSDVLRRGQSILEEMDLLFEDRSMSRLIFKEKQRFDPYNPVEIEVQVRNNGGETVIELDGRNLGEGPYQETHVKRMIFELMDRLEEQLPRHFQNEERSDPGLAEELEVLSRLHSQGVLTDFEFARAKKKLLE